MGSADRYVDTGESIDVLHKVGVDRKNKTIKTKPVLVRRFTYVPKGRYSASNPGGQAKEKTRAARRRDGHA